MKPDLKIVAVVAALGSLTACHTDPFGLKPDVNVTLPEEPATTEAPASETAAPDSEDDAESELSLPAAPAGLETDMGPGAVPWTDRLVRGLPNAGTVPIEAGKTLTLAIGANREDGYIWVLDPIPEGLELVGDYYREAGTDPNRPSWATLRYFMFRSDRPGQYALHARHTNGTDTRVEKDFVIEVTAP